MNTSGESGSSGVAVFDFNWGGHIPAFHAMTVEAALRAGAAPVWSLSGAPATVRDAIARRYPRGLDSLKTPQCDRLGRPPARASWLGALHRLPGGQGVWNRIRTNPWLRRRHALQRWNACRQVLATLTTVPHLVFFPYLDDMLEPGLHASQIHDSLGAISWAGIFMDASDWRDPQRRHGVEARLRPIQGGRCTGVGVLDEAVVEPLADMLPGRTVRWIPDLVDNRLPETEPALVSELRRRARGRKIVALLGHLTAVKNLELFLAVAARSPDLFYLLAGQYEPLGVSPSIRSALASIHTGTYENILAHTQRMESEADFNALFSASDILFAVYRNFTRSSNILSKAAAFARPVVVAEGYCMADRVRAYRLGVAVHSAEPGECLAAIRSALARPPTASDCARYSADFSFSMFQSRIAQLLDYRFG